MSNRFITFFSIPKPFTFDDATRQFNAIASWHAAFQGHAHIVLYGDDSGVNEAAQQSGAEHVSGVPCNEFGTPLLDWVFRDIAARARTRIICYINSDILLDETFAYSLKRLTFDQFLMVGRRYDVDVQGAIDPQDSGYSSLYADLIAQGTLRGHGAIDYFAYTCGLFRDIPAFAVGRPRWDNWMIGRACELKIPIVDVTEVSPVAHQNHEYDHVKERRGNTWNGPEGDRNREIAEASSGGIGLILDASHTLCTEGLKPNLADHYLWRSIKRLRRKIDLGQTTLLSLARPRLYLSVLLYRLRRLSSSVFYRKLIVWIAGQGAMPN